MEITTDMITQFGLMNKVSTGRQWLDIMVCLAIPFVLKTWMPRLYEIFETLCKKPKPVQPKMFTRRIEFHQKTHYYWGNNNEPPNNVLQQAIIAYLNREPDLAERLEDAVVELAEQPKKKRKVSSADEDGDSDSDYGDSQVQRLGVSVAPPTESWVTVEPGLEFMREEEFSTNTTEGTKRKLKTVFHFRTAEAGGNTRIDTFIQKAFTFFKDQRKEKVDRSRYMYVPVSKAKASDDASTDRPATVYKRYKLSEEKTFSSLFHPERDHILKVIADFKTKTGKFAIPGYPQKLGFLLYGPPGTGKTTFIKALAQATGRNIISVPLAKIRTNQELTDVMFEQLYRIEGQDMPVSMNFSKVLFVMEDVDAACHVVQKRTADPLQTTTTTLKVTTAGDVLMRSTSTKMEELPAGALDGAMLREADAGAVMRDGTLIRHFQEMAASPFQMKAADAKGKDGKDSKEGKEGKDSKEGKDQHAKEAQKHGGTKGTGTGDSMPGMMGMGNYSAFGMGGMTGMGGMGLGMGGGMGGYMGLFQGPDDLNLAGLLNVLDGVVDTPDRLVVMTTNHPEKLDPALVRPGRINRKIFMGRMKVHEALQMVRHYFADVSAADEAAVRGVFVDEKWSPAELESMCAEYDSVRELVEALAVQVDSARE